MASRGPWSVKGIDMKAREAALQAARSEGVTLGEYLNRILLEDEQAAQTAPVSDSSSGGNTAPRDDESLLERLVRRLDAAETRSTLAVTGIDQSVFGLASKLENAETAREAMEGRLDLTAHELRQTQELLQRRIERVEADDTSERNLEALKSLENTLSRLAQQVDETQTEQSAKDAAFEAGLSTVQTQLGDLSTEVDNKVTGLADIFEEKVGTLSEQVETTLEAASHKVQKAVEQAELRTEGTARHLSERMSKVESQLAADSQGLTDRVARIEGRVNTTLSTVTDSIDNLGEKMTASDASASRALDLIEDIDTRNTALQTEVSSALDSMDETLARITDRLSRTETTTDAALKGLEQSFNHLDQRFEQIDADLEGGTLADLRARFEDRLKQVSTELAEIVSATREELSSQIDQAATMPTEAFSEMNTAVSEMHKRMKMAEQRQAQAVDALGDEVAKLTGTLDERVQRVEQRNSSELSSELRDHIDAMAKAFSSRISDLEARETGDISAVGDKMNELATALEARIAASEEHSASAIKDFTEHVTTLTKSLQARQDEGFKKVYGELKQSEERQANRLKDSLGNVSERIAQIEETTSTAVSPIQKAMASLAERLQAVEDFTNPPNTPRPKSDPLDFESFDKVLSRSEAQDAKTAPDPVAAAPAAAAPAMYDPWADEDDMFAAPAPATGDPASHDDMPEFSADVPMHDGEYDLNEADSSDPDFGDDPFGQPSGGSNNDYLARARAAANASMESNSRSSKHSPKKKPSDGNKGSSKLPLFAAASVLALTAAGTAGYMMLRGSQEPGVDVLSIEDDAGAIGEDTLLLPDMADADGLMLEEFSDEALAEEGFEEDALVDESSDETISEADEADLTASANVARVVEPARAEEPVNLAPEPRPRPAQPAPAPSRSAPPAPDLTGGRDSNAPTPTPTLSPVGVPAGPESSVRAPETRPAPVAARPAPTPAPAAPVQAAPQGPTPVSQYQDGLAAIQAGDLARGAENIRAAAEGGLTIAQYRLSKLYERGQGLPRDLTESRRWTEQAANSGNVKAMHDLAVFFAEGEGGPQSYAGAVQWFRQAADFGLVDSQYNLGVLYEQGLGVSANPAEALYWFRVANTLGDNGAANKVTELSGQLPPDVVQRTLQLADQYSPATPDPVANGTAMPQTAAPVRAAAEPRSIRPQAASATQSSGADVSQIRAVQNLLNAMGYNAGVPDGQFGPLTRDAIRNFEMANGITPSGQVSPTLIRQLEAAASRL